MALHEVPEAPGADDIDQHAIDLGALADGHLGLRHSAFAHDLGAVPAQEMQDGYAAIPPRDRRLDELGRGTLLSGRHHPALRVPACREAGPVARVAPDRPVLDQGADLRRVVRHIAVPKRPA